MDNSRKKVTFIELFKIIKKRVRLSTLILLLITFSSTTFAWFVYATKITTGITAHIEAWNILFTSQDNLISEYVYFTIPDMYPGMADYNDGVSAYNLGDKQATIYFEVISATILGVRYIVDETTLTSDMVINKLASDYPFKISLALSNESLTPNSGRTYFSLNVHWPYESGNDAVDTYWGKQAYDFNSNNPDSPSIELVIKISAIQSNE